MTDCDATLRALTRWGEDCLRALRTEALRAEPRRVAGALERTDELRSIFDGIVAENRVGGNTRG